MTEQEALQIAEPVVRGVVNCMADRNYEGITEYASYIEGVTPEKFRNWAEEFLELNGFSHYDRYGFPNNFQPQYDKTRYQQMSIYIYNDGTGFGVEYDLTSDSELNDLTLIMDFFYNAEGDIKAYIEDLHVL